MYFILKSIVPSIKIGEQTSPEDVRKYYTYKNYYYHNQEEDRTSVSEMATLNFDTSNESGSGTQFKVLRSRGDARRL
jgi:hypothetical protein